MLITVAYKYYQLYENDYNEGIHDAQNLKLQEKSCGHSARENIKITEKDYRQFYEKDHLLLHHPDNGLKVPAKHDFEHKSIEFYLPVDWLVHLKMV